MSSERDEQKIFFTNLNHDLVFSIYQVVIYTFSKNKKL